MKVLFTIFWFYRVKMEVVLRGCLESSLSYHLSWIQPYLLSCFIPFMYYVGIFGNGISSVWKSMNIMLISCMLACSLSKPKFGQHYKTRFRKNNILYWCAVFIINLSYISCCTSSSFRWYDKFSSNNKIVHRLSLSLSLLGTQWDAVIMNIQIKY